VYFSSDVRVHIFEIRPYAGRAFRTQVYASDANDTFSILPKVNDIKFQIQVENDLVRMNPGLIFNMEPSEIFKYQLGLIFGNLTMLKDESQEDKFAISLGGGKEVSIMKYGGQDKLHEEQVEKVVAHLPSLRKSMKWSIFSRIPFFKLCYQKFFSLGIHFGELVKM
jgi:hypothetical protein